MGQSETLFQLQKFDTEIDKSYRRIAEIDTALNDRKELDSAIADQQKTHDILTEKQILLSEAEQLVADQNKKIDQNQKKLYGGLVSNPKELEDLQLEYTALSTYLTVLEERQLEDMVITDQAKETYDQATSQVNLLTSQQETDHAEFRSEKEKLTGLISITTGKKDKFLTTNNIPDLPLYESLRKSLGGIAVTLMVSNGCSSCGANIPSAIAQEARSSVKMAACPTCKRILYSS
ncbi:MAG: hypothetical protein MUP11_08755 [Anaerolineales bacterium]|nr:hypothetical protein [Anaerolineales bacterium]